jgi:hypothetical protein
LKVVNFAMSIKLTDPMQPANKNKWYVLATVFREQEGDMVVGGFAASKIHQPTGPWAAQPVSAQIGGRKIGILQKMPAPARPMAGAFAGGAS